MVYINKIQVNNSYRTIEKSIANIPDGSTKRYILILNGGTMYRENVLVSKSKSFVTIRSDDPINPAIIVWNDTAATLGKDSKPLEWMVVAP
jgi:pectinesterase